MEGKGEREMEGERAVPCVVSQVKKAVSAGEGMVGARGGGDGSGRGERRNLVAKKDQVGVRAHDSRLCLFTFKFFWRLACTVEDWRMRK